MLEANWTRIQKTNSRDEPRLGLELQKKIKKIHDLHLHVSEP